MENIHCRFIRFKSSLKKTRNIIIRNKNAANQIMFSLHMCYFVSVNNEIVIYYHLLISLRSHSKPRRSRLVFKSSARPKPIIINQCMKALGSYSYRVKSKIFYMTPYRGHIQLILSEPRERMHLPVIYPGKLIT